jgi:phenylacetic acid degradation operon negative regulatory protein
LLHLKQSFVLAEGDLSGNGVRMKPKTEEFLNLLLWSADKLMRPTFRNLTDSYEAWAYGNGLLRQAATLEQSGLLECDSHDGDRLYRLTEAGRLHALGGRDPDARWSRPWDGKWRMVIFDVPMERHVHRGRLRRYLRQRGFGCLQGSVWITPDLIPGEQELLADGKVNVNSLILMEARPCMGESDSELVDGAWDFGVINGRYAKHLKVLGQRPDTAISNEAAAKQYHQWIANEWRAWRAAVDLDPLLPRRLLPTDYLGCRAWKDRLETFRLAGERLQRFTQ